MNIIASGDNSITLIGNVPLTLTVASPTEPTVTMLGIPRGVTASWSAQPTQTGFIYFSYRSKVGAGAWSGWIPTFQNSIIRYLTAAEMTSDGYNATVYFEVKAVNVFGGESTTGSGNAACRALGGLATDYVAGSVDATALAAAVLARMFTTSAKLLSETTESAGFYLAAEHGADITANNIAGDTTLVNEVAAATVQGNAANGKTAYDKIVADLGAGWAALVLADTADITTAVDARLSAAERANLVANETIDGTYLLYHTGNKPVKADVGLTNADDKSSITIRSEITKANVTATGLAAADIDAIDTDLSNAPATIKNVTVTISADGTLNYAGGGQVTPTGLGLGNVENYNAANQVANGLALAHITALLDLDTVPEGTTFKRMPAARLTAPIRMLFADQVSHVSVAVARTDLPTYFKAGAGYVTLIVIPYTKLASETAIILDCLAEINDANFGHLKLEVTSWGDVGQVNQVLDIDTGGNFTEKSITLTINSLTNGDSYILSVRLEGTAADTLNIKGVNIYTI